MNIRQHLLAGQVIPAHPLALTAGLSLDERHQRALTRYYVDAGAGGIAVGVHTTQFAIRDAGLYRPVLELAMEASCEWRARSAVEGVLRPFVHVAGVIGSTEQAVGEAQVARALGYDLVLVSLGGLTLDDRELVAHCRAVAEVMPVFGFYLQPAVGGRPLGFGFWRELAEVDQLWAVKIAPFNRYMTLDVVRAMAEAGRDDVALYTGNDDSIVADLVTPFPARGGSAAGTRRIVGGLLGQWAVWTRRAVELLERVRPLRESGAPVDQALLAEGAALTEANAAIFDATNGFAGCIPGIHEVLRRQGLLQGTWCLDPAEVLSPGQADEIDRVLARHPELADDEFVAGRLDQWLS